MRYVTRNADGKELVCPSLADLHALYVQGFLTDEDMVRAETSQRWEKVGQMAALRGIRERRRDTRKVLAILAAAAVLVIAFVLLARGGR